jgi:hypothetical protein
MAIEHGEVTPPQHPSGNRGVHGIEGFNAVVDEAARAAIIQTAADRSRVVRQTAGVKPGYYIADGAGSWQFIGDATAVTETVLNASQEFWVATTGNDSNLGSVGAPWLTYARAAAEAMKYTTFDKDASMRFHFAAGSYVRTQVSGITFRPGSFLIFLGDALTTLQGSTAMAAGTDNAFVVPGNNSPTEGRIVVAAPLTNPAVDAYVGKTVLVTSGPATGFRYTIASNTSTVIRLADNGAKYEASFVVGNTFTIVEPAATLTTTLTPNEYEFEQMTGGPSDIGTGVVLCNFKVTGSYLSGACSCVTFLGLDAPGVAVYVDGDFGAASPSYARLGGTTWKPLLDLLGAPTSGPDEYWSGWYSYGNLFKSLNAGAYSYVANNGFVFSSGIMHSYQHAHVDLYGGRLAGSGYAQPGGSFSMYPASVLMFHGGGGPVRCEWVIVVGAGTAELSGVSLECVPYSTNPCILVKRIGHVVIDRDGASGYGCLGGAGVGFVQPALSVRDRGQVTVLGPFVLVGGAGVDWDMAGLSGLAADIVTNNEIRDVTGSSIIRGSY